MSHFKVTEASGVVHVISSTDCETPEAYATSAFGMELGEVEAHGARIERLTDNEYYTAIGRTDLLTEAQEAQETKPKKGKTHG